MYIKKMLMGLSLLLVLDLSSALPAQADDGEDSLMDAAVAAVGELSAAYLHAKGPVAMKVGLVLAGVEEASAEARGKGLGSTVRAYFEEALANSAVFYLVERENLGAVLGEIELAMTGIFEGEVPDLGALKVAGAIVMGRIVDAGGSYRAFFSLVDVSTAVVICTSSFELTKETFEAAAVELAYSYVAPNGIGLFGGMTIMPFSDEFFNKGMKVFMDSGVAYRPGRNWMIGAGVMVRPDTTGEDWRYDNTGAWSFGVIQPGLLVVTGPEDDLVLLGGSGVLTGSPGQYTATMDVSLAHVDAQYTLNLSPNFNIGMGGSLLFYLGEPRMTLMVGAADNVGMFYRQQYWDSSSLEYGYRPAYDQNPVVYDFQTIGIAGGRVEIKPEWFITPRLSLGLRLGYLYTLPCQVGAVTASEANWSFRPYNEGVDAETWVPGADATGDDTTEPSSPADNKDDLVNQKASWAYYGWNPLLKPDGSRWVFDLSGAYATVTLSFFF